MIMIIIIILILIIIYVVNINFIYDLFDNTNIDFYVITLDKSIRKKNIIEETKKNKLKLNIIEGINWKNINQDNLLKNKIIDIIFYDNNNKRDKEIGCYLSHFKIYNIIKDNNKINNYSIILEDDFNLLSKDITNDINKILQNMVNTNFDIIFLGNTFDNIGNKYKENIYHIDKNKETIGCFAYLINNSSINKIINQVNYIDEPIDSKINSLIKTNNLIVYTIYPNLINYKIEYPSEIIN